MEREAYGVVLTAGSKIKRTPLYSEGIVDDDGEFIHPWRFRLEPDTQGKMRSIAALNDLLRGEVSKVLIAGGAPNYRRPLANIYLQYLRRFIKRYKEEYGLEMKQIQEVLGGINTLSDLAETRSTLQRQKFKGDVILYSSEFHLRRTSTQDFAKHYRGGQVTFVNAEEKIEERHRFYGEQGRRWEIGPIGERLLTPDFLAEMNERNRKVDLVNKFHGTWVVQLLAYAKRSQTNLTGVIKLDDRTLEDYWKEEHATEKLFRNSLTI